MAEGLRFPVSADLASFQREMGKAKQITATATKAVLNEFTSMNAGLAAQGAKAALGFTRQGLAIKAGYAGIAAAVVGTIAAINHAVELGKERIEELTKIADKAAKVGVSSEFFQRATKAADDMKLKVDDLTKAFDRLKEASEDKLGGSSLNNRIKELRDAGNFKNNAGVSQLNQANNPEERMRALANLISIAAAQGERLAAIDLAEKFLPASMMERLRENSDFLRDMLAAADRVKVADVVSEKDIAYALELKKRLEDAHKTLENALKPVMTDIAKLGMQHQENWISIVERMAAAVGWAAQLYGHLKDIPGVFAEWGNSPVWGKITNMLRQWGMVDESGLDLPSAGATENGGRPDVISSDVRARLAARLRQDPSGRAGQRESTDVYSRVFQDKSKNPTTTADEGKKRLDQVESLINAMQRSNEVLEAELKTIGMSNEERSKAVALAKAEAAARQAGRALTEDEKNKVLELASAHAVLEERMRRVKEVQADLREFGSAIADAFKGMVIEGKKFDEVLESLIKRLASRSIDKLFELVLFGGAAGPGGGISGGLFGSLFGRAGGGPVQAGRPYQVGERGRELFVPNVAGRIVPNHKLQSGGRSASLSFNPVIHAAPGTDMRALNNVLMQQRGEMMREVRRSLPGMMNSVQTQGV